MNGDRPLVTTLRALIDEEHSRTLDARDRLGSFVPLAERAIALLNTLVTSVDRDHFMAAALMLSVQKSATLAFLSHLRGHTAQGDFNSRQLIEFCALTAYMLAHPDEDVTRGGEGTGGFAPPKWVSVKAYRWLEAEHPHVSAMLKEMKDQINDTASHASLYLTHFTFEWRSGGYDSEHFRGSFFDSVDDDVVRTYLMSLSRLMVVVIETLRLASADHGGFTLKGGAEAELRQLDRDVNAHRDALGKRMGMTLER